MPILPHLLSHILPDQGIKKHQANQQTPVIFRINKLLYLLPGCVNKFSDIFQSKQKDFFVPAGMTFWRSGFQLWGLYGLRIKYLYFSISVFQCYWFIVLYCWAMSYFNTSQYLIFLLLLIFASMRHYDIIISAESSATLLYFFMDIIIIYLATLSQSHNFTICEFCDFCAIILMRRGFNILLNLRKKSMRGE